MNLVCIDGDFYPAQEAKVSVFDHGLLYGDGLFETMRAYNGKIFALDQHLKRLRMGADMLRIELSHDDLALKALLLQTLQKNNLDNAYIRLTYTRGSGPIGIDPALCAKSCLIIMAKESNVPEETYRDGINLGISPVLRNPDSALPPSIKSLNFLNNILAKIWAKENGFAEALMLNQAGYITETTVSNIFFVREGRVFTPSLEAGILPGVTRDIMLNFMRGLEYGVEEGLFKQQELLSAEEVFLTNSGSEVIPVTMINKKLIGSGKPGKYTRHIHQVFQTKVKETLI